MGLLMLKLDLGNESVEPGRHILGRPGREVVNARTRTKKVQHMAGGTHSPPGQPSVQMSQCSLKPCDFLSVLISGLVMPS